MIQLKSYTKPSETFDASNPAHRKLLAGFVQNKSWSHADIKLTVKGYGNSTAIMQRQLLEWYTQQEFTEVTL